MAKILCTGISGMDGQNLSEYLLSLGHDVYGILRRHSVAEEQNSRIAHLDDRIKTFYGDVTDAISIDDIVKEVQPTHIISLAAMSHVQVSFSVPQFTMNTNFMGVLNLLESARRHVPNARIYHSASSEMFGLSVEPNNTQNENTVMNPTSPYGISKLAAYGLTRHYRRAYGMFACNGILFNHSGPGRSSAFSEAKIVKTACMIKLGLADKLELGNLDACRDFGASKDYVRGMWQILNAEKPDDYVIATGQTHSIREMCEYIFKKLDMDYKDYVVVNPKFFRKEELPFLRGDSTKIRKTLGWKPEYTFESLFDEMIAHWLEKLKK